MPQDYRQEILSNAGSRRKGASCYKIFSRIKEIVSFQAVGIESMRFPVCLVVTGNDSEFETIKAMREESAGTEAAV